MAGVILKSYANGINVLLNPELSFEKIKEEVATQFKKASPFFKNAKVALSIEGKILSTEEEKELVEVITSNSQLDILYLIGRDDRYSHTFLKACEDYKDLNNDSNARMVKGNVKNNECIESDNSIIVIGDVYPGCKLISSGNIIVLGGLYGEAYAGRDGDANAFVAACEMNPEVLMISDLTYSKKPHKWGFKPKYQMQIAHVCYGNIVNEPISTELLRTL